MNYKPLKPAFLVITGILLSIILQSHISSFHTTIIEIPFIGNTIPVSISPAQQDLYAIDPVDSRSTTPSPTELIVTNNTSEGFQRSQYITYQIAKNHCVGTFVPPGLESFTKSYSQGTVTVSNLIANDLRAMIQAAALEGVELKVVSGYRSYTDQAYLFEMYVQNESRLRSGISRSQAEAIVNTYSARPGCSEHQLGTVVDVLSRESNYTFAVTDSMKFIQWIKANSTKYHFKISYPQGNPEYKYEPWHLRWWP